MGEFRFNGPPGPNTIYWVQVITSLDGQESPEIGEFSMTADNAMLGVDFVDANTGWAVGTSSLLNTTDGGPTWNRQEYPATNLALQDVDFVDAMNGWVVGEDGIISHTSDGGANWNEQIRTFSNLFAVDFLSLDEGWAAGEAGTILHTTNGGAIWLPQPSGTSQTLHGIAAIPEPSSLILATFALLSLVFALRASAKRSNQR